MAGMGTEAGTDSGSQRAAAEHKTSGNTDSTASEAELAVSVLHRGVLDSVVPEPMRKTSPRAQALEKKNGI